MHRIFKYPVLIIAGVILITVFFGLQLPRLQISGDMANFLPAENDAKATKQEILEVFGSQENVVIMVNSREGSILEPEALTKVAALTEKVENIPYVKEVVSLSNMDHIEGMDGGMRVTKLINPDKEPDPAEIRRKLTSWEMYSGLLYSEDFQSSLVILTLDSHEMIEQDGKMIQRKLTDKDYDSSLTSIRQLLTDFTDDNYTFMLAGEKVLNQTLKAGIVRDLIILMPVLCFVLILILMLAFRTPGGIILPLLTVLISSLWTMGFMSLIGVELSILTMVIPILLVAVGSAYAIHILSHFYDKQQKNGEESSGAKISNKEIVLDSLRKVGLPVILAGLTTVIGFASLSSSSVEAMRDMGIFSAVGVFFAVLNSLFFIPAVLALGKGKEKSKKEKKKASLLSRFFLRLHRWITRHNAATIGLVVLLLIVSMVGFFRISVGQPWINFFRSDTEMYKADQFANNNFAGTTVLSLLISGNPVAETAEDESSGTDMIPAGISDSDFDIDIPEEETAGDPVFGADDFMLPGEDEPVTEAEETIEYNSVKTPQLLAAIDDLSRHLQTKFPPVKKVTSLAGLIKQLNKVMHADEQTAIYPAEEIPGMLETILQQETDITARELIRELNFRMNYKGEAYYEIPTDPEKYRQNSMDALQRLISQYLFLYSGNISDMVDNADNPVKTLVRVQMNQAHPEFLKQVIEEVNLFAEENILPLGYTVETAGYAREMLEMNSLIVKNQLISILLALSIVILIVALANKSLVAGLFCALPIIVTLCVNFGFMGFVGYPLDVVTAMIASLAIGIGIDYSIHFLSTYKREFRLLHYDHTAAALATLQITGKAILFNAASVAAGFAVLLSSLLKPLNTVGAMIVLTMFVSSMLAMVLIPVILKRFNPAFLYASEDRGRGARANREQFRQETRELQSAHHTEHTTDETRL